MSVKTTAVLSTSLSNFSMTTTVPVSLAYHPQVTLMWAPTAISLRTCSVKKSTVSVLLNPEASSGATQTVTLLSATPASMPTSFPHIPTKFPLTTSTMSPTMRPPPMLVATPMSTSPSSSNKLPAQWLALDAASKTATLMLISPFPNNRCQK